MATKKELLKNINTVQGLLSGNKLHATGQTVAPTPGKTNFTTPDITQAQKKTDKSYMSIGFDVTLFKYLKFITSADGTTVTNYLNRLVEEDYKKRRGELNNII